MANQTQIENLRSEMDCDGGGDGDDEELEKLEADVSEMAEKILEYRTTLPDQLKNALASTLAAQRPVFPTRNTDGIDAGQSGKRPLLADDQETAKKTQLLRDKISRNVSAMPVLLKRMKDCISRIDSLEPRNGYVHPAFKRKRASYSS
ncbi:uncharacterized protein LOC130753693 [Actinidia eriantha]|uniref:uncharacterized protein LOC130753693 n=1 Tax=Actinidia eriantha TaxID=165200 RepID=UPI00258A071A|nr:uncharacterized protein LOC130753693 [Actinidia eriantha]